MSRSVDVQHLGVNFIPVLIASPLHQPPSSMPVLMENVRSAALAAPLEQGDLRFSGETGARTLKEALSHGVVPVQSSLSTSQEA